MRQKLAVKQKSLLSKHESVGGGVEEVADNDFVEKAKYGIKMAAETNASEVHQAMANALREAKDAMSQACDSSAIDCDFAATKAEFVEPISIASIVVASVATLADEKMVLKDVIRHDLVTAQMRELNQFIEPLQSSSRLANGSADESANMRMTASFRSLAAWQDGLVDLGEDLLDRQLMFPSDMTFIGNCPRPCKECTRKHNSWFKVETEKIKFKCILESKYKNTPPSNYEKRIQCERPRRRWSRFWQFKTWCTAVDWTLLAYQRARISAMLTCGSHSVFSMMKTGSTIPQHILKTCMLVEQRMAVTMKKLREYKQWLQRPSDGVVSEAAAAAFAVFVSITTAKGLVGVHWASEGNTRAPSEDLSQVLRGSEYTFVPPELMKDVPCDPPVASNQVFLGVLAAIVATASGVAAGILVTFPLLLFTVFWWFMIGFLFHAIGVFAIFVPHTWIGVILLPVVGSFFGPAFLSNTQRVYQSLTGRKEKSCSRGIMVLNKSQPLCIASMEHREAKRYDCPADKTKSIVLSCEHEFEGFPVIRGEGC